MMSCRPQNGKDTTYRNDSGGGPSQGDRQHAQDRACGYGIDRKTDRQTHCHTHTQTDILITILVHRLRGEVIV